MATHDERTLPSFDNHYSNGVLVDNWQEDRLYASARRGLTIGTGNYIGPCDSVYKTDFTTPLQYSAQPMMRRHGLGKELMFSSETPRVFSGNASSTTYGAFQRELIDSKYQSCGGRKCKSNALMDAIPNRTFSTRSSTRADTKPTDNEEYYGSYSTTKHAMDIPVECYQFQRQMTFDRES